MKIRYLLLQATLVLLAVLAVLSVWGAFMGAQSARQFFNSPLMASFWLMLLFALLAGLFLKGLRSRPGMLIIHAALILILAGGLWGSQSAHQMRNEPYKGYLYLYENTYSEGLMDPSGQIIAELPFRVILEQFRIEYYGNPSILVTDKQNPDAVYQLPPEEGQSLDLGDARVTITSRFANLQLREQDGAMRGVEGPQTQTNPAYELTFTYPDGRQETRYVFERFAAHDLPKYRYHLELEKPQMIKDYISSLAIEADGQTRARKDIEVNHPLHYGGYHFYQNAWGENEHGQYSIIEVVSDGGLNAVFAGYGLLSLGIVGQFWLLPAMRYFTRKKEADHGN